MKIIIKIKSFSFPTYSDAKLLRKYPYILLKKSFRNVKER